MRLDETRIHAIRDEIMVIVQREFRQRPTELLAAQLLALKSLTETAKEIQRPVSMLLLDEIVDQVLCELKGIR
jgi:hypothetical protein